MRDQLAHIDWRMSVHSSIVQGRKIEWLAKWPFVPTGREGANQYSHREH